jgi:magnesium-transporting ATPase (P-type)
MISASFYGFGYLTEFPSCFTDCAAAVALAYEAPEADVLYRPPRHPKNTRLVDWKLIFHSYGVIGMIETVCSFSMAFWYLQRNGIPFSDLWFKFGEIPSGVDVDYYNARVNEASSIYFITLVIMCGSPYVENLRAFSDSYLGNGSTSWLCALAISQSFSIHPHSTRTHRICTYFLPLCLPWVLLSSGYIFQAYRQFSTHLEFLRSITSSLLLLASVYFASMKPERQPFVAGPKGSSQRWHGDRLLTTFGWVCIRYLQLL